MSLINQMLQDLEKRRASGAERGALPDQVRVLPQRESNNVLRWLAGIAVALASLALLAWNFNRQPTEPVSPLAQTTPAAVPTPAPNGPVSALAPTPQPKPPAEKMARGSDAPAKLVAVQPFVTRRAAREDDPQKLEKPPRESIPIAKVVKPDALASTKSARPAAVNDAFIFEPAKRPPGPPAADSPTVPAASPVGRKGDKVVEARAPAAAPPNPQIDKRAQTLSAQQVAENEYREAANFLNQGRSAEAQDGFRRALQNNPAHAGARQALFGLLVDAKKTGEAEQLLQEGLAVNPNQPGFAMALSGLQYERGNVTEAIETMQKSAPAAQASPDYLARLAGLLQRQARHREAVESYQAALRLAPGSGVWLMGMGISLQALNRNPEAQDAFRRARNSNTLNPELQAFVDQRLKQLQ